MKANELMIGDWVYAIDINGEKHPCRANNLEYDYTNKREDFCVDFYGTGYEAEWPDITFKVEPIPLTPEILEKNGFKYIPDAYVFPVPAKCYDFPLGEGLGFFIEESANGHFQITDHCFVRFRYVHEFQHVLRLCGIDKEIII